MRHWKIIGAVVALLGEAALQMSGFTSPPLAIFLGVVCVGLIIWSAWPVTKRIRPRGRGKGKTKERPLKIEVSKCYFAQVQKQATELLTLIVELTLQVSVTPTEVATLQLGIGLDKIEPTSPILPIKINSSPSSYVATYEVSIHTLIVGSEDKDAGRICVFAIGQEWLSNEFSIPYDSTLLPQEVSS